MDNNNIRGNIRCRETLYAVYSESGRDGKIPTAFPGVNLILKFD